MLNLKFPTKFLWDEDGAITVDWVVLSAAIIGLAVAGVAAVQESTNALTEDINTGMSAVDVIGNGE
ncbi:hypothetical protein [Roseovarius sp. ZX-A-9]|uniref:hypothetical protein n=1 Tax=Roseovarius sp. ZX-A-9 TaxID=3014783 RepID=UPI00232F087D|nr:hypothetical protein [Roseovarius sp. ZX-A-9]